MSRGKNFREKPIVLGAKAPRGRNHCDMSIANPEEHANMKTPQIKLKNGFAPYPDYRDSGISWIGKIPAGWELSPWRSVLIERKEKNRKLVTDNILSVTKDRGVIRYADKGDIGNKSSDRPENYKIVYPNDIVINSMNLVIGSVGIARELGVTSSVYLIYQANKQKAHIDYFHYLIRTVAFQKHIAKFGKGIMELRESIKADDLKNQLIAIPPLETQKKIAEYLDEKTALIDRIIERKKKLVKLLKEAVYSSVVTGIREDGMAQGDLWRGADFGWVSKKAKWIFEEINIRNRAEEEMLAVTQNNGVVPKRLCHENFVSSSSSEGLKLVEENDFVISLRSFQGGIEYSEYKGLVSPAYTVIRLRGEYNTAYYRNYYKYLLKSSQFIGILNTIISGIRDGKNIVFSDFKDIVLPIPPVDSLDRMMALAQKVELLASYLKRQEDILLEFKSALISNVVTGKVKV